MGPTVTNVSSENGQIMRWVLLTVLVVLCGLAMWLIRDILLLSLTAVILAILLTTPIRFFVRYGIRRPMAVLLTLALALIGIGAVIALLLPGLLEQLRVLVVDYIPSAARQLQTEMQADNLYKTFPFLKGIDLKTITDQISTQFLGALTNVTTQLFPFVGSLASIILSMLIILFLTLYFIADPDVHQRGLISLMPVRYRPRGQEILVKLDTVMRKFLQAQIVLMLLIGAGTGIALWIIGMPLAGVLGTITGLFSFVPNFGPLVALVPILAVAIINTPDKIGLIIVVYYVLQFIQSQLITPLLMGQEVNLPPAVILLSQIIAGIFFGFLGLLLSVPLAAILMVLVQEIYIKDILGDRPRDRRPALLEPELESDGV